jgi:hypothetical protein
VLSYPRRAWWTRLGIGLLNIVLSLTRREFHFFVHEPKQITATSESRGLHQVLNQGGVVWIISALTRAA